MTVRQVLPVGLFGWMAFGVLVAGCSGGGSGSGSAPPGCAKDTDCKGDRVCVEGACVDPQGTSTKPAAQAPTQKPAATQKPAPPPASTAAGVPKPRLLNAGEQAEVSRVLSRFIVDFKQTFRIELNGFGDATFASTEYKENQVGDYLVVSGGKTYALPQWEAARSWKRHEVKAVWFGKLDKDDLIDVIAIADHLTGVGPTGAKPFPVVLYYFASGPKTFRLDEDLSKKATDKGISSILAAHALATPTAGAATEKPCTGEMADSELPCNLTDGRIGWCKAGKCKDICPAGYSYSPLDTQCHQPRDCKASTNPDGTVSPVKTARCGSCMEGMCMDDAATKPLL